MAKVIAKETKEQVKNGNDEAQKGIYKATKRGFGFITFADDKEDVFVYREDSGGAFDGDQVEFIITKTHTGRRREGKVIRILSHQITKVVGLFEKHKNYGFVRPDNPRINEDIYIPLGAEKDAVTGQKVVVELLSYGNEMTSPEGKVTEILGFVEEPGIDILSIVKDFDLPVEFPEKVNNQAIRVGKPVSEADCAGRLDLRNVTTITIDGEDAKDFDDAISMSKEGENYKLGVHIADVTNYVQEGSALDREALKRGTSVYLADRVIPMLPPVLSNDICSLKAGEDRLALSCIMTVNSDGELIDHLLAETVIRVDSRLTYTGVARMLAPTETHQGIARMPALEAYTDESEVPMLPEVHGEETEVPMLPGVYVGETKMPVPPEDYAGEADMSMASKAQAEALAPEILDMCKELAILSKAIRKQREKRGSIDFDFPETKIILDESGKPIEIKPYERSVATNLIEDFMLLANETVAEEYFWRDVPFLYRTHESPEADKIRKLRLFINNFGYNIRIGSGVRPMELQKLLHKIDGVPEEMLISRLTLRSMKRAQYSPNNQGHFGLAAKHYTHFTSPIRRYPDLQIHRIIKETIRGRMNPERVEHYQKILPDVATESSRLERRAEEAERETIRLKKAEYMKERLGQEFEGVISGVTKWGIYVELPNTVEGLVHISNMWDDYYEYIEEDYELVGEMTGKVYKLGQKTRVRVTGVDLWRRTIDFSIPEMEWSMTYEYE